MSSESYRKHSEWCRNMAEEYRRDAPTMREDYRTGWLARADRLDEEAVWYAFHADLMERPALNQEECREAA